MYGLEAINLKPPSLKSFKAWQGALILVPLEPGRLRAGRRLRHQFRMATRHGGGGERSPRDRYAERELAACETLALQAAAIARGTAHYDERQHACPQRHKQQKALVGSSIAKAKARGLRYQPKQAQAKTSRGSKSQRGVPATGYAPSRIV